jgi:hypothetical protein
MEQRGGDHDVTDRAESDDQEALAHHRRWYRAE